MEEVVHVVPLGWEYERAVLPLNRFHAHRAYLLCDPAGHPRRRYYLDKVRSKLEGSGTKVTEVYVDTFMDLPGTMREVSRIVQAELNRGSRVHVNISAAGRLASIAAALAAMAHLKPGRGSIYYIPAVDYPTSEKEQLRHGMSRGMKGDPIDIPLFELGLPNLASRLVLSKLLESKSKRLGYADARLMLAQHGLNGFGGGATATASRQQRTKWNVNLYRRVVQDLVRRKLVEVESVGREKTLRLTRAGEYMACLSLVGDESPVLREL